jgi:hypothetical protein
MPVVRDHYSPSDLAQMADLVARQVQESDAALKNAEALLNQLKNSWRHPLLTWNEDGSTVTVSSMSNQTSDLVYVLNDVEYTFEGPQTLSLNTDLLVGEKAKNTSYYVYLTPESGTTLVPKLHTSDPETITGLSVSRYSGSIRTGKQKQILPFAQIGNEFTHGKSILVENRNNIELYTNSQPVEINLESFVPKTCAKVFLTASAQPTDSGVVRFFMDGSQGIGSMYSISSTDSSMTPLNMSIPTPGSTKRIWRQISEFSGKDYDIYRLICVGWIDGYLI